MAAKQNLLPIFVQVVCTSAIALVTLLFYFEQQNFSPFEEPYLSGGNHGHCEIVPPTSWSRGRITVVWPAIATNCNRLWSGEEDERAHVRQELRRWKPAVSDYAYLKWLISLTCWQLRMEMGSFYVSEVESKYPLAFTVVVSQHSATMKQYFRHLKAIYRPHNAFCYHVDPKSSQLFIHAFRHIASCLDNVILSPRPVSIHYGSIDHVTSQMSCFIALANITWKHMINLAGTEVPLKTNREIVDILQPLEGYTLIQQPELMDYNKILRYGWNDLIRHTFRLDARNPVFKNITLWKSITYSVFTKEFITFLNTDTKALELWHHLREVSSPEELLYATVNQWPGSPGNVHQLKSIGHSVPVIVEVFWVHDGIFTPGFCLDRNQVHHVCIATVSDLPQMVKNSPLFFNKYLEHIDHVVMDCAEERLIQTNLREYREDCLKGES